MLPHFNNDAPGSALKVSIIIPTLDRPHELRQCLDAIVRNFRTPEEVIIVDQGDAETTRALALPLPLPLKVVPLPRKSLAQARNLGVHLTSCDLVLFVDDDVEISREYISVAVDYMDSHPDVLGITGRDLASEKATSLTQLLKNLVAWLFWRWSFAEHSRVLLSGCNILKNSARTDGAVDWLSGVSCWRRTVFEEGFAFNTSFARWSCCEDAMFSYQVGLSHPKSLWYVPDLRFSHWASAASRISSASEIRMKIIYRYIFWRSCVHQGRRPAAFAFWWSQIGFVISQLVDNPSLVTIATLRESYLYLIKYRARIASNRVNYNDFILNSE
jgi:glycosyltransferase involved in cell wall biosynthesis